MAQDTNDAQDTTDVDALAELRNRGLTDVLICCCDGLTGPPDAITATRPRTTVQTCCAHLMRASLRFAAKQHYPQLIPRLKAIYAPPTEGAAEQALAELKDSAMGKRYPAIATPGARRGRNSFRSWRSRPSCGGWSTTRTLESINARLWKVTRNRGHFTSEAAAVKVLYLAIRHLIEPKAGDRNQVPAGWRSALNQLTLHFGDRITIR